MNGTLLESEARSATTLSADVVAGPGQRGILVVFDVTDLPQTVAEAEAEIEAAETAEDEAAKEEAEAAKVVAEEAEEGTLTLSIEGRDPASGKYVALSAFTATKEASEAAAATLAYSLYPGASETAAVGNHEVQALPLPRKFRVKVTHSAAGEWTYSVGVSPLS